MMSEHLPPGWTWTPLGELADTIRGVTYKKPDARKQPGPGLVPLLRATNIGESLTFDDLVYVPEELVKPAQFVQPGDLVIATSSGSVSVVGKAAPVKEPWRGTFGAFCTVLRPSSARVDPRYLRWFMTSPQYRDVVSRLAAGVNINNLKRGHIEGILCPLSDLQTQARVVDAIEQQMRSIGEGDAAFTRAAAKLDTLLDAVLNDLVAEASAWPTSPLGELCERVTSGSRDWKPYYGKGSGVFVLTQNVRMRRLDVSEPFHVDPPANDPARARSEVRPDDILVTIVGANCGNLARVAQPLVEHYVCQSLALVRLTDPSLSAWLELFMSAPAGGQAYFERCYYGQGRPHLSFNDIKRMPVPVPDAAFRERAVQRFGRYAEAAAALLSQLEAARSRSHQLKRSYLRRSFLGEFDATEQGVSNRAKTAHAVLAEAYS